jgi:uncharacterized integral membrane protein
VSKDQLEVLEKRRKEFEQTLEATLAETMRKDGPMNAVAWTAVVVGAFVLNLLLLMAVAG